MLKDRLRTSAVLITIVLVLLGLDYRLTIDGAEGVWLIPLLLFFALGTAWEMGGMLKVGDHPNRPAVTVAGTAIVSLSATVPFLWAFGDAPYPPDCPVGRLGWIVLGASLAVFLILVSEMRSYHATAGAHPGDAIRRTATAVFVSMYVGVPMAMLVALRGLDGGRGDDHFGLAALVTAVIVTKVADAGAYFSGRSLGRRKLVPRLSPGKTLEGAVGGVLASTVAAWICLRFLFPGGNAGVTAANATGPAGGATGLGEVFGQPLWGALLLGPTLAIAGMVGDLAESLFKRDSGVKDSGNLLPGLGGVWDVTDSLIAASVPAFFCFALGVGG
jgi:phosphatidate cytidylyltransferase